MFRRHFTAIPGNGKGLKKRRQKTPSKVNPQPVYHAHPSLHPLLPPRPTHAHTQNVVRCGGFQSPPGASLVDAGLSPPGGGRSARGPSPVSDRHTLVQRSTNPHPGHPHYIDTV
eukprot:2475285-Prymnesium_polylepis.1